jgi:rhodanese-related sulfurtransferase
MSHLITTRRAAILLVSLGLLAAFAGSPYQGTRYRVDAKELARIVEGEVDHVSPEILADWIIQGKADFRLIDLRTEVGYSAYHIPGAEHVTLTALPEYGLTKNEKIVLYSAGGIHSAQAWFLLKAKGYEGVYLLRGGLEEWQDKVLFPKLAADPTPAETVEFSKMRAVSAFFGGTPQAGGATGQETAVAPSMPKLEMPQSAQAPAGAPKKKKKEGC